jgi:SNF2 family DNA or RNA helicase
MKFYTKPWKHQIEALKYLISRKYGALYTDMGSGKTKIMIDLIVNKDFKKTIIVCPKKVCRVWLTEFSKHAPHAEFDIQDLSKIAGNNKVNHIIKNRQNKKFGYEVLIVNYESIWRDPLKSFLLNKYHADCIICDESHRIKSPGSKCSKFLHLIGKKTEYKYLMTGTPLAQSPLDIYAQYRFLDPEIFGTNFNNFKYQYSNWIQIKGEQYSIIDKRNPYKNLDELHRKMFSCAFKIDSEIELPETQDIIIEYDIPKESDQFYQEIKKEGCLILDNGIVETSNVVSIVTKLQQIMSGYLPIETKEGKTTQEIDTARQDVLYELIENIPPEEPIIIFAKYTKDIKDIHEVAKKLNRGSSEISGKVDTLDNWLEDKTKILAIQIRAGAEGLNLTKAKYCIYYTLTYSLEKYQQSRKRVHRPGQTRPVVYYTIIGKIKKGSSIDDQIFTSLQNNENLISKIMRNKDL